MASAGEALATAARRALAAVSGLNGVYEGMPIKASPPYAIVDIGTESDWSWKAGEGREIRLAATIRDLGERPARLRRLIAEIESVLIALSGVSDGWRIVNIVPIRIRAAQKGAAEWSGTIEVRARMEREGQ